MEAAERDERTRLLTRQSSCPVLNIPVLSSRAFERGEDDFLREKLRCSAYATTLAVSHKALKGLNYLILNNALLPSDADHKA